MAISYDEFDGAFLSKISEYDLITLFDDERTEIVDGYLKRAVSNFRRNLKYDFATTADDEARCFNVDVDDGDLDEIVDIVSDGMVVQWLKPFINKQEILQNYINTRDFTTYSMAELILRVGNAYAKAQKDYRQAIREYSYNHGDLRNLHT